MKRLSLLRSSGLAAGTILALAITGPAAGATCDRACLLQQAAQFNSNMLGRNPGKIPLADGAEIRENTKAISLDASKWSTVKQIRSEGVYTDSVIGNVIEHVAAETDAGKIVYIGTRLKVADSKITEVEINFDDGPRVNAKNLIPYDPIFSTIVPEGERSTREQLERIITSYFQGLTDHKPIEADYDPRCDRYHSGNRVTHNARNGVESSVDVGCYESNLGPKPWGPATETRIALIDPERGIVIGYSISSYGNRSRSMQIQSHQKSLERGAAMPVKISLMEEGITTSGFTH